MTEPLSALRTTVTTDIAARISDHQQAVAARPPGLLGLAVGDSWADYPLDGLLPKHTDYVTQLPALCAIRPTILNLAHYGDASTTVMGLTHQARLERILTDPANGRFDFILASMGGDDIVGESLVIWLNDAADVGGNAASAINTYRLQSIFAVIRASFMDLIALRDKYLPGAPILAHSYDYAIPSGIGLDCGIGPWLKPGLDFCGWTDPTTAAGIVKRLLVLFAAELDQLAGDPSRNFVHVKTQGLLTADQWANELHPRPFGFKIIADRHPYYLRAKFPGRI